MRILRNDVQKVLVHDIDPHAQDVVEHVTHHLFVFEDDHVVLSGLVDAHREAFGLVEPRVQVVDEYRGEKADLLAADHVPVVQEPFEQLQDAVADLVLLQVARLRHARALAGEDLLDHVLQHVHVGVGLVVLADEQVRVPLLHVRHLVGGVHLLDEDVLGLAVELDLLAQVDQLHFEREVRVEFQNGRDLVHLPLAFGQRDAVLERTFAERRQQVDLSQQLGLVLREQSGVGRVDELVVELDLAAQFLGHHLDFVAFDDHIHPNHV